ncbi:MAG: uroporphyrinogen decarboxylase family protein [Armatimonadota bacterium]
MQGSLTRVRAILRGEVPDRAPLFDLLRNGAVIRHFTGEELTVQNGAELVYTAYDPAIDATRPMVKYPNREQTVILPDGRKQEIMRWTVWTEFRHFVDSDAYEQEMRTRLGTFDPTWTVEHAARQQASLEAIDVDRRKLGDVFYFPSIPGPGLMGIYGEVGLEYFSYYLADCPDIIPELLEMQTVAAEQWYRNLPTQHAIEAGFLGDDIAFKTGPLFSVAWLRAHYFPRLARTIAAAHLRGIRVLFHSDGNLNPILDDLVEAGIDGLNPIEVLAGMDVGEIHHRHPHLFMAGGIDVSHLLPYGTPQQVRDAVTKAIHDADGRILIGSSTELNDDVPLANYLALREAVLMN